MNNDNNYNNIVYTEVNVTGFASFRSTQIGSDDRRHRSARKTYIILCIQVYNNIDYLINLHTSRSTARCITRCGGARGNSCPIFIRLQIYTL